MTMPNAGTPDLPARRRDEFSDWHDLLPGKCGSCGCTFYYAKDDPGIVWDPGRAWDEACSNRSCSCHDQPVIGTQRA
jgi:hypothetical protein